MTALSDSTALEDLEDPSAFPVLGIDEDAERGQGEGFLGRAWGGVTILQVGERDFHVHWD